jgi:hypothetical protein
MRWHVGNGGSGTSDVGFRWRQNMPHLREVRQSTFASHPLGIYCTMIRQPLYSISWKLSFDNALGKLIGRRSFTVTHPIRAKKMPDRPPPVNEDEFTESYLKGSGPGGQKIVSRSLGTN